MCTEATIKHPGCLRQRGVTLVELIVFIIVMSVGVVGVLSTMSVSIRFSAEPMVQKQLSAIAESLLAEILNQPFTLCDPDDANASTATLSGTTPTCAIAANDQNRGGGALNVPTPAGETRSGAGPGTQFDNVADYGGFSMTPVTDVTGGNLVAGYSATVNVARAGTQFGLADNSAALQVTVTASRGNESIALTGYRFRYAPRY
ncbi:MAG: prepilin-type N-terminal cleavage/methylation domain-containing protein [Zoogloeaceae bacterium]|nr:prepilin-type N-terminal cleavage/methylation domain-containing protein [Zoogloeaceae bacterium]